MEAPGFSRGNLMVKNVTKFYIYHLGGLGMCLDGF